MNKSLITAAAIATLAISSTSAFATATANAQLTGLTISLSKIKNSGPLGLGGRLAGIQLQRQAHP